MSDVNKIKNLHLEKQPLYFSHKTCHYLNPILKIVKEFSLLHNNFQACDKLLYIETKFYKIFQFEAYFLFFQFGG